jgi:hypothetical protein
VIRQPAANQRFENRVLRWTFGRSAGDSTAGRPNRRSTDQLLSARFCTPHKASDMPHGAAWSSVGYLEATNPIARPGGNCDLDAERFASEILDAPLFQLLPMCEACNSKISTSGLTTCEIQKPSQAVSLWLNIGRRQCDAPECVNSDQRYRKGERRETFSQIMEWGGVHHCNPDFKKSLRSGIPSHIHSIRLSNFQRLIR